MLHSTVNNNPLTKQIHFLNNKMQTSQNEPIFLPTKTPITEQSTEKDKNKYFYNGDINDVVVNQKIIDFMNKLVQEKKFENIFASEDLSVNDLL